MRGRTSKVGDTRIAPNGYHYTRTREGWTLTHRLVVERQLQRQIGSDERVRFRDGNRSNLSPENLEVYKVGSSTRDKRRARLQAKIEELQAQLRELDEESLN
jgi:hypothetical protein